MIGVVYVVKSKKKKENFIDEDEDEDELDEDYDYDDEEETEQDFDEAFINGGDDTESVDTDENDNEDNNNENDEENGEDVVLNVIVDIIKIAEITSVERKVTAECLVPFFYIHFFYMKAVLSEYGVESCAHPAP